ncbi:hypothetical protein COO60DRAFT_1519873 [Scenedesmus sp. NREL 46B-D3]|nr:hypothetical protein COO60DRAFT_1519873 [Scenedesmus sp. NREL 46B-D3]
MLKLSGERCAVVCWCTQMFAQAAFAAKCQCGSAYSAHCSWLAQHTAATSCRSLCCALGTLSCTSGGLLQFALCLSLSFLVCGNMLQLGAVDCSCAYA